MDFLVLNKSVNPPKVSRLATPSVEEAIKGLRASGLTDFDLYCNVSDESLARLFSRVDALERTLEAISESSPSVVAPAAVTLPTSIGQTAAALPSAPTPGPRVMSVDVRLKRKHLIPANPDRGIFEDSIQLSLQLENLTGKIIRATKGDVVFSDLFGADIFRLSVTINEKIAPGRSITWNGAATLNQFIPEHMHFASFQAEDLTIRLEDEHFIFA